MRIMGRALLLLLLIGPLLWAAQQPWQLPSWLSHANIAGSLMSNARPSAAYLVDKEHWLEFVITGKGDRIKILSNAGIDSATPPQENKIWAYALEYQLLSEQGELIEQRVYHHRSKLSQYLDPSKSDAAFNRYFYLDSEITPINVASLIINTTGNEPPLRLRLRLSQAAPDISDVAVRVYQPNPIPSDRIGIAWVRLSSAQKTRVARSIIYEPEQLRAHEISNLLNNRYSPTGPIGVLNEDYHVRTLYSLALDEDEERVEHGHSILPAGIYADQWLRGVMPIPQGGARVSLNITPTQALASAQTLTLRWYGQGPHQRSTEQVTLTAEGITISRQYDGGLIEFIAPHPIVVQPRRLDSDEQDILQTGQYYLRGYTSGQHQLEYRIDHTDSRATPFRVDLRAFTQLPSGVPQQQAQHVNYHLVDKQGNIIKQGQLSIKPEPSRYDRFAGNQSELKISEPSRYFFTLPAHVARVRFSSSSAALITAYSRPAGMPRTQRLPEDRYANTSPGSRIPAWFLLKPSQQAKLIADAHSALLIVQTRPPEDDAQLLAGQYDWQNFQPQGDWLGRFILQPRDAKASVREEARSSVFRPLTTGQRQHLDLFSLAGIQEVKPRLVFIREQNTPFHVEVRLDGQLLLSQDLAGSLGEIALPPIAVGRHQLQINSNAQGRWLINYAGGAEESYLKRLAYRLPAEGLSFDYDKTEAEAILSAQLFLPHGQTQRSLIQVRVEKLKPAGIGPFNDWSFTHRINDILPTASTKLAVLNSQHEQVSDGQRFFIPLGSDLAAGRYRVHISPDENTHALLALYQLRPGTVDQRQFFSEKGGHDDTDH